MATGSGGGAAGAPRGAGQYPPHAGGGYMYGHAHAQQQQQQASPNARLPSYQHRHPVTHPSPPSYYYYAHQPSPLHDDDDDGGGASRIHQQMHRQHQVMAMQSEQARRAQEAAANQTAAIMAAAASTCSETTPTSNSCTPLAADGRPVGIPDEAQEERGMVAPGSGDGGGSGRSKRRKTSKGHRGQEQEDCEDRLPVGGVEQVGRKVDRQVPQQPQPHPRPMPHPQYASYSPAVSFYSYSPTTRAPQRFTFDAADVTGGARAHAHAHARHPRHHYYPHPHGPAPYGGSPTTMPPLPPVPVTMGGGSVVTPGGAAAAALMTAPLLGTPLHLQGQPFAPGANSSSSSPIGRAPTTTSFSSVSGLTIRTHSNGELRLADGTLLLASSEDRTAIDLSSFASETSRRLPSPSRLPLLLPEHVRLARESVEVFCATVVEDVETVADGGGEEDEGQQKKKKKKRMRTTAIGQMGLRCVHCRHLDAGTPRTAPNAVFYPTNLADIYNCVMKMEEHHFSHCRHFPPRERLARLLAEETLKGAEEKEKQKRDAVKVFFRDAALEMGLVDNPEGWGIRYFSSLSGAKEVSPTPFTAVEESAAEAAAAAAIAFATGEGAGAVGGNDGDEKGDASVGGKASSKTSESSSSPSRLTRYRKRLARDACAKVSPRKAAASNSAEVSPSPSPADDDGRGKNKPSDALQAALAAADTLRSEIAGSQAPRHDYYVPMRTLMGIGASTPLIAPSAANLDHYQGHDMEALQLVEPPTYESILNFPQGAQRKRRGSTSDMRVCIMCGLCCPTTGNKKKGGSRSTRGGDDAAVVPLQNKGVCTKCDVLVWVQISTGCQIKWCKGCKHFRNWAHFGPKGWTTKCTKCREQQNANYAEKRGANIGGKVKNTKNGKRRGKNIDSRVARPEQEAARELLSLHSPKN